MDKELTCCFTGHRPSKLGFTETSEAGIQLKNRIASEILGLITERGVKHFISGAAMGVDTYAAETVLKLREVFPDITLECAVPCRTQSRKWSAANRERYEALLGKADKVTVLHEFYTYACMKDRDRYMTDNADIVLAVWNGSPGGTAYTVAYAREQGREIIILPETQSEKNNEES